MIQNAPRRGCKEGIENDLQEAIIDLQSIIGREEKMKKAVLIKSVSPIRICDYKRIETKGIYNVCGTSRGQNCDVAANEIHRIFPNVTPGSLRQYVSLIFKKERRIDILVNNAGYGSYGTTGNVLEKEAHR